MTRPKIKDHYPDKLNELIKINNEQPEQRTLGWYEQRNNMITASDIATLLPVTKYELNLAKEGIIKLPGALKIGSKTNKFGSLKEFIQKKCGIVKPWESNMFFKWGIKYEPVIAEIYEKSEGCELLDFGLMPHPTIPWLGASPDGITDGLRMIEIKAPLKRKIEGAIPAQYWMQMQIQLEVCDLDVCDFVEVELEEYNKESEYFEDCYVDEDGDVQYYLEKEGLPKGTTICIKKVDDEGKLIEDFVYPPLMEFESEEEERKWIMEWISDRVSKHPENAYKWIFYNHSTFSLTRFKVIKYQKIIVNRDKEWFALRKPELEEWWNTILEYRETGLPEKYQPTPENVRKLRKRESLCQIIESDDEDDDLAPKKTKSTSTSTSKPVKKGTVPTLDLWFEKVEKSKISENDVEVDEF